MRGTRHARIVVADGLLALRGQLVIAQVEPGLHEAAQVVLDGRLVLRGGRNDPSAPNGPVTLKLIPLLQHTARRLGHPVPGAGPRWHLDVRRRGLLIAFDQPEGLLDRAHDLDGRTMMDRNGFLQVSPSPAAEAARAASGGSHCEFSV